MSAPRDPRLDPRHPPPWQPLERLTFGNMWQVAKQIDELGGEWTYRVFVHRAANFNLVSLPITFYEPIESFDKLELELVLIQKAYESSGRHCPKRIPIDL
jgi:hypothetical protein